MGGMVGRMGREGRSCEIWCVDMVCVCVLMGKRDLEDGKCIMKGLGMRIIVDWDMNLSSNATPEQKSPRIPSFLHNSVLRHRQTF